MLVEAERKVIYTLFAGEMIFSIDQYGGTWMEIRSEKSNDNAAAFFLEPNELSALAESIERIATEAKEIKEME